MEVSNLREHLPVDGAMFSSAVNPTTGKLEWVPQETDVTSEEADISHELARSQYGDMLLDKSRVSVLR